MPEINPSKAPLWEIVLSASTADTTVYSPYNVAGIHAGVAATYPVVERQGPFTGYEVHPVEGAIPSNIPDFLIGGPVSSRWFFTSEDSHRLVQLQENFVAANWRRLTKAPGEVPYPGFEAQLGEFRSWVEYLRTADPDRPEQFPFPPPTRCEISYDNLVPLTDEEGNQLRFKEVFAPLQGDPRPPNPVMALQTSWFRRLKDTEEQTEPQMRVIVAGALGIDTDEGRKSYLRIQIICRAEVSSWDDCFAFFERAHEECSDELFSLTTERVHATWRT